jgi:hypothetical protein
MQLTSQLQGDVIDQNTKIILERNRIYTEGESLTQRCTLYSCAADNPPEYMWDSDVEEVATLKHTIDRDELRKCERKKIAGKKQWRVDFKREISLGTREGTLMFRVLRDSKVWGHTEVQYDNKPADTLRKQV